MTQYNLPENVKELAMQYLSELNKCEPNFDGFKHLWLLSDNGRIELFTFEPYDKVGVNYYPKHKKNSTHFDFINNSK